jgi:hypothetical protein
MKSKSKGSIWLAVIIVLVIAIGVGFYFCSDTYKQTQNNSDLTTDQIFQESSSQLGFTRDEVIYFRIFGPDKIQYSLGSGTSFAYKMNGVWNLVGAGYAHDIAFCSEITSVPEQYNPGCYDQLSKQTKYIGENGESINYPYSSAVSYIGE